MRDGGDGRERRWWVRGDPEIVGDILSIGGHRRLDAALRRREVGDREGSGLDEHRWGPWFL